jgi:threonine dehydratase
MGVAFEDVLEASRRISTFAHRTPVLSCRSIDEISGSTLFFKCENFQKAGAFKFRGACNAVLSLCREEAARGVLTHSSGNHAQALSLAAGLRGIPAFIVMPSNASRVKVEAVRAYGGRICFCEPTLESREKTALRLQRETSASFIHPYNDERIIAGQGTAALELLEEIPELDAVLAPVGGGGLLSGTALSVKALSPRSLVIGCEPRGADDAHRSFRQGRIIPAVNPQTIADGLRTSLGEKTFEIIREKVDDIWLASEEMIVEAMRMLFERAKVVVEPSAAVPLAALMESQGELRSKRVGIILSGGNVDLETLPFRRSR